MTPPTDPYQAVTHPDPWPYYARLCARGGLHRVPGFEPWIAADAATVEAVLTNGRCRVRPLAEPIPRHLEGAPEGALFGRLVRMNDEAPYPAVKQALGDLLAKLLSAVRTEGPRQASRLFTGRSLSELPARTLRLPVQVLGTVLGLPEDSLEECTREVEAYVRSVARPDSPGHEETARLTRRVAAALACHSIPRDALTARTPVELAVPNAVGLLTQAYEATAGLIGQSLLALARVEGLRERVAGGSCSLENVVREAARHGSPVQNTRRFLHARATVAGQELEAGATVVVVLAAANRDPRVNPQPDAFLPDRPDRRTFTFGLGAHACPGRELAVAMATAAVERVLAQGPDLTPLTRDVHWRASTNARVLGGVP